MALLGWLFSLITVVWTIFLLIVDARRSWQRSRLSTNSFLISANFDSANQIMCSLRHTGRWPAGRGGKRSPRRLLFQI